MANNQLRCPGRNHTRTPDIVEILSENLLEVAQSNLTAVGATAVDDYLELDGYARSDLAGELLGKPHQQERTLGIHPLPHLDFVRDEFQVGEGLGTLEPLD